MNLLDLGDEELIAIFQRVDQETKLNLMMTCKRFENVIGNYFELFGKFKLAIEHKHLKSPHRVQTLTQMRRHFGTVKLDGLDLNLDTKAYNLLFQLLTKIGSNLVELHISCSQFCFVSLVNLLNLTPNITKLFIREVQMTPKPISSNQIKLESLKRLEINNSSSIEIFEKLKPNYLHEIKISGAECEYYKKFTEHDYRSIPRILSKQDKLVLLELSEIPLFNFPESPDWSLENLQKLVLNKVKFPVPEAFKNFTGFLKTLDKLTDLSLTVEREENDETFKLYYNDDGRDESDQEFDEVIQDEKQRIFTEMLTELFSLPRLTKLEFEFDSKNQLDRMANLKVQNPGVQELTLKKIPVDEDNKYSQFMKIFPNVRKAKLDFHLKRRYLFIILREPDLTPINSWASLKELEVFEAAGDMLSQIKNLRTLKIDNCQNCVDYSWYYFCQNNRQLERLEGNCDDFSFNNLQDIAYYLPNLKVLILKTILFESVGAACLPGTG
jgi:hypothetical protein